MVSQATVPESKSVLRTSRTLRSTSMHVPSFDVSLQISNKVAVGSDTTGCMKSQLVQLARACSGSDTTGCMKSQLVQLARACSGSDTTGCMKSQLVQLARACSGSDTTGCMKSQLVQLARACRDRIPQAV
jgi:hypothetical protein